VIVVEHGYVYEAGSVIEPDGNVAEPVRLLLSELGEHGLDQLFVLAGGAGLGGVADDGGLAHHVFPCSRIGSWQPCSRGIVISGASRLCA
jgi:hypothetical protein